MKGREVKSYLDAENMAYLERRRSNGLISDEEYARRVSATATGSPVPEVFNNVEGYAMINIYKCKFVPTWIVEPLSSCSFRECRFTCPAHPEEMLRLVYGEYMELPPYEKRLPSLEKVAFNAEK